MFTEHKAKGASRFIAARFAFVALLVATAATSAWSAQPRAQGGRRVGIDMRFGEVVREGTRQLNSKNYARAVALFTQALAMKPDPVNESVVLMHRGSAQIHSPNHAGALADFDRARRLRPRETWNYNDAAWLRATSPDASVRNGKLAVQQATRACELSGWKRSDYIDTLAAAHAEAGNFERAIEFQKQAMKIAPFSDRRGMTERLRLYETRTPYRLKLNRR